MKNKVLLIFCMILNSSVVFAETYEMNLPKKKVKLEIQKYEEVHLSESCLQKNKKPTCDAYAALTKKIKETHPNIPLAGHPAATFCGSAGGVNRILTKPNTTQYDFCEFKDKSMIDSWDLYNHFHK